MAKPDFRNRAEKDAASGYLRKNSEALEMVEFLAPRYSDEWWRGALDYYRGFISKDAKKRDRVRADKKSRMRAQMDWYSTFDQAPSLVEFIYNNGSISEYTIVSE